jgi:eukaryotic-like serine/threonine-protein kinase
VEGCVLVGDRYAIYQKIAAGGMATVHFGRLRGGAGFARTVAIKRLHPHLTEEPDFVSMMIDEARLVARVHHPNVVPTLDVVAVDGELLIVMEYVQGESLGRLLSLESARRRPIPLPIVSAIISGVLHGLHAAHEARSDRGEPLGIVHRDISPQNVMVGVDGVSRVIDFGVAKAAGRLQTTREGVVKGKVPYMAPEQVSGKPATRSTDIYSVGIVLWETITQRRLFRAEDEAHLIALVLAGAADPPSRYVPDLPGALVAITMRALARNPDERFATAHEMALVLEQALPPAQPREVGAWVLDAARDTLSARAATLAAIETDSSGGWQLDAKMMPVRHSKTDSEPPPPISQPSSSAPNPRRWAGWAAVGAASLVALSLVALLVSLRGGRIARAVESEGVGASAGGAASAPSSPPSAASSTVVTESSPTLPASAASDSIPQATLPARIEPQAPASSPPTKLGAPAARSAPRAPVPRPRGDCDPPYTVDSTGLRIPKPACY